MTADPDVFDLVIKTIAGAQIVEPLENVNSPERMRWATPQ
jgi:hypothetical protein